MGGATPNNAVNWPTAGAHVLAAAGQRERSGRSRGTAMALTIHRVVVGQVELRVREAR